MKDIWVLLYKILFACSIIANLLIKVSPKDMLLFDLIVIGIWIYGLGGMLGIVKTVEEEKEDGSVTFMIKIPIVQWGMCRIAQVGWCLWRAGMGVFNLPLFAVECLLDILLITCMSIDKTRYTYEYLKDDYLEY